MFLYFLFLSLLPDFDKANTATAPIPPTTSNHPPLVLRNSPVLPAAPLRPPNKLLLEAPPTFIDSQFPSDFNLNPVPLLPKFLISKAKNL